MIVDVIKDSAWLQIHNVLHGFASIDVDLEETKTIIKDASKRAEKGTFDPLKSSKGLIDCIVFYNKHKAVLDD